MRHQGYCFLRMYIPGISQFLPCMLQFLDNIWRLFIFLTTREIGHFTLDHQRRSEFNAGPSDPLFLLVDHPKENRNKLKFNPYPYLSLIL